MQHCKSCVWGRSPPKMLVFLLLWFIWNVLWIFCIFKPFTRSWHLINSTFSPITGRWLLLSSCRVTLTRVLSLKKISYLIHMKLHEGVTSLPVGRTTFLNCKLWLKSVRCYDLYRCHTWMSPVCLYVPRRHPSPAVGFASAVWQFLPTFDILPPSSRAQDSVPSSLSLQSPAQMNLQTFSYFLKNHRCATIFENVWGFQNEQIQGFYVAS